MGVARSLASVALVSGDADGDEPSTGVAGSPGVPASR